VVPLRSFAVVFLRRYKQTDDMDFSSVDSNDGVDVEGLCMRLSFLSLSYGRRGVKLMDVMDMDIYEEEDVMDCD
jgi:hypothetical protein